MSAYQKINVNEATVCSDVELRSHVGGLFVWNNPLRYTDPINPNVDTPASGQGGKLAPTGIDTITVTARRLGQKGGLKPARGISDDYSIIASEIKNRDATVFELKQDAIRASGGLGREVFQIITTHDFIYVDKDDLTADYDGNEWGANNGLGVIEIGSLHWNENNVLNRSELVDTFFHEIQHSRRVDNSHGPTVGPNFQNPVDGLIDIFNDFHGEKWK